MNKALTISGADCLGTSGIQKDLETFYQNDVKGVSITTSIIAHSGNGSFKIEKVSKDILKSQFKVVNEKNDFDAIKVGTIIGEENIHLVGKMLRKYREMPKVILNVQLLDKNEEDILSEKERKALIKEIFPITYFLVINKKDVEKILDVRIRKIGDIENLLEDLKKLGPMNILVRGLKDEKGEIDILYDGDEFTYFIEENLETGDTYEIGEGLSGAITSFVANKYSAKTAIKLGKKFLNRN